MSEELSVNRHENKYEMDIAGAVKLMSRLSKVLSLDDNSNDGGYIVRSLYFDTINNNDYNEKK